MAKSSQSADTTAIIFDFDGTLADTLLLSLGIFYQLAHRTPLPREDVTRSRAMGVREMLRALDISPWRAVLLWRRGGRAMAGRLEEVALFDGVTDMLRTLAQDYSLYIVSSNRASNVANVLQRYGVDTYIQAIEGNANPFNKAWALRRLSRRHQLLPSTSWYIGDQAHDVVSAHRAGLRAGAVTWGFSNLHVLQTARPELLAFGPDEITNYFTKAES